MNVNDQIMTKDLAKGFVDHRSFGFGPERISEFPLDHAESRLDVRAAMVVLQELFAPKHEVVVHVAPRLRSYHSLFVSITGTAVFLERDERSHAGLSDVPNVFIGQIALVRRKLGNREVVSGRIRYNGGSIGESA